MDTRYMKAGVLGAVAVFIWGAISNMVIPWHQATIHKMPGESEFMALLEKHEVDNGVYVLPQRDDHQEMAELWAEGPLMWANVRAGGVNPPGVSLLLSFIADLIMALTVAWIALRIHGGFGPRVCVSVAIGLMAALWGPGMHYVWWGFASDWTLVMVLDSMVTWLIGGLVIAKFLPAAE